MKSDRLTLETFEDGSLPQAAESPEYLRGWEAAQRDAESAASIRQATALEALTATLADMSFGYEEARSHLLKGLASLLEQLSQTALPEILKETFGLHLRDIVLASFEEASTQPINIVVAPDLVETVEGQLKDVPRPFTIGTDQNLSDGQVLMAAEDTHQLLDLQALLQALQSALSGLDTVERKQTSG